jgi:cytochrome P450
MDEFPEWAQKFFDNVGGQVSHGLNLALPLKSPAKLPLLLWDIVVAQPKIRRALEELSFVHYARFVPSWDGTALMVITEFDGPLEPYVMDFAIAIGDVFDTLLSYVAAPPPLPVREHPQEFWDFVREWNRVPFAPGRRVGADVLFPPGFDYPLYSAYPDKTVTDIAGRRKHLPRPAIDRPGAAVDLDDVQGNILNGYRAKAAVHLFFSVVDPAAARRWLSGVFPREDGNAWRGVMNAARWGRKADGSLDKPELMTNVAFTYAGLLRLLPQRQRDLKKFPLAFRQGAQQRAVLNGDIEQSDPTRWKFGRDDQNIHVVLSLYASGEPPAAAPAGGPRLDVLGNAFNALSASAAENGMKLVDTQAAALRDGAMVHFDYVDGIAKPRISGQCQRSDPDSQPSASPGEFLLGKDYKSIFGGRSIGALPEDLAHNGTFGVMRLIEQDVDAFNRTITDEAARLNVAPALLKAKLMGRWEKGQPLALDPETPSPAPAKPRNDFDYSPSWEYPDTHEDHEGGRCPVGAHIRRANPRSARVAGQRHSRRLIRRGMPSAWADTDGNTKVGLLGLFVGASIERQFEFIQREWIQGSLAASGIRDTQDPIAGLRLAHTDFHMPGIGTARVPPLVATRASLYLFFPGIGALKGLDEAAAPSTMRALEAEMTSHELPGPALAPSAEAQLEDLRALPGLPAWLRDLLQELSSERSLNSGWNAKLIAHFAAPLRGNCAPASPEPPGDIAPLDPRFIADPYRAYAELRHARRSVVWVPQHEAYWVLMREPAQRLFVEPHNFLQRPSSDTLRGIITMDDPRHRIVRAAVEEAFGAATKRLDSHIDRAIGAALTRLDGRCQFDFLTEYGAAVPSDVFWCIFGLTEPKDVRAFDALAQTMMRHYGQPVRRGMADRVVFADAAVRLAARVGWLLAKAWLASLNPIAPGPWKETLIGEIAARTTVSAGPPFALAARPLHFFESLVTLVQLVLAGYMSSQFLLGSAMRNFLMPDPRADRHGTPPWQALADIYKNSKDRFGDALKLALEEGRRFDPPVTIVERYAACEQRIGDTTVAKDCPVFAVVASANRDMNLTDRPEEFHWDRPSGLPHLSLGHGIHECVGKALQAALVPKALTRLIDVMPDLRLCDPKAVPAWFDNLYFRGLQSLPVHRCP